MSLLEQDSTRNKQIDKNMTEFETGNSKEYKVETIWNSAVYANKAKSHLPGIYYLIVWKRYPKEKNT